MAYPSPFTDMDWANADPLIGVIVGAAHHLFHRRPRLRPPITLEPQLVTLTTAVQHLLHEAPNEAYWRATEVRQAVTPHVGEAFIREHMWWPEYCHRVRLQDEAIAVRVQRLLWLAAKAIEKAITNIDERALTFGVQSTLHYLLAAAQTEIACAAIDRTTMRHIERAWRFTIAAGRLPHKTKDALLLDAFEAALSADAEDFANHLARHGWGQGIDPDLVPAADGP